MIDDIVSDSEIDNFVDNLINTILNEITSEDLNVCIQINNNIMDLITAFGDKSQLLGIGFVFNLSQYCKGYLDTMKENMGLSNSEWEKIEQFVSKWEEHLREKELVNV
jgi:hypothetical protein